MKETPENYTRLLIAGLIMTVLIITGLLIYSLQESPRLVAAAEEFKAERIQRGEQIYQDQCVACHGAQGEGGSGPALNNRTVLKNTLDHVFFSVIRSGVPGTQMPAWSVDYGGPLTDEDVRDVVALLRAWEATAPEIEAPVFVPDPAQGARLFSSTCAICHGTNGSGTETAPQINNPERLQALPDDWYREVINNGRPAKGMPTWGTVLSPNQVEHLVALIAAWRKGEQILPDFTTEELVASILYALEQNDLQNAAFEIERAISVSSGSTLQTLDKAASEVEAGEIDTAKQTILSLQSQAFEGDPTAGAAVYSVNCAACHGVQGEGGIGPSLVANPFTQSQPDAGLRQFILYGRPGTAMVGFQDRLNETQMRDLITFLRLWSNTP